VGRSLPQFVQSTQDTETLSLSWESFRTGQSVENQQAWTLALPRTSPLFFFEDGLNLSGESLSWKRVWLAVFWLGSNWKVV
jgi:hypothetical protein